MGLKDLQGERAIEALADIMDPAAEIFTDPKIVEAIRNGEPKPVWIKAILKGHAKAVIDIMAILDNEDRATYNVDILTLPAKLLQIFNDPELADLFTSQGQPTEDASSGSAQAKAEAS